MKILRNAGKIVGSSVFILALTIAAFTIGLTELTEYGRLKVLVKDFIDKQIAGAIDENSLTVMYQVLLEECKKNEKIELSALVDQNISIDCKDVKETRPEGLVGLFGNAIFDSTYYKKYDCGFIECLQGQEKYSVVVSYKAHLFFKNLQNVLLVVSGIGLILMLVSIETWQNRLKSVGISLIFVALPFFVMILLKDRILPIPPDIKTIADPIVNQLFGSISNIFLLMLVAGVVLTTGGYLIQHYRKVKK